MLRHFWILIGVFAMLGIVLSRVVHGRLFMNLWPWADLYVYQHSFARLGTKGFFLPGPTHETGFTYPNTMVAFYGFYYAVAHPLVAYLATVGVVLGTAVAAFAHQFVRRGFAPLQVWLFALSIAATSYPLWLLIQTGNLEIFVILFAGLGLAAYLSERYWWAGVLFGIAASLKYFPIILFALLFSKKHYKQALLGLFVGGSYWLLSSWAVGPTLADALRANNATLGGYSNYYVNGIRAGEIGYDHSLYSVVKHVYLVLQTLTGPLTHKLGQVYQVYLLVASTLAAALYFAKIRKLPALNQALAIVCLMLMLPPVSYDYRLLHLYVPFGFFAFWMIDAKRENAPAMKKYFALFALLFTPQTYLCYWIGRYGVAFPVTYGAQAKTFSLLCLLVFAVLEPMAETSQTEADQKVELTALRPREAIEAPA